MVDPCSLQATKHAILLRWFLCIQLAALVLSLCGIGWSNFMLHRNHWVHQRRTAMLETDFPGFLTLASYKHMLRRWWVWDIEAFLPGGKHHAERLSATNVKRLRRPARKERA